MLFSQISHPTSVFTKEESYWFAGVCTVRSEGHKAQSKYTMNWVCIQLIYTVVKVFSLHSFWHRFVHSKHYLCDNQKSAKIFKKYRKCSKDKEAASGTQASCSVWDSLFAELQSKSWQAPGSSVMGQTSVLKMPCPVGRLCRKRNVSSEMFFLCSGLLLSTVDPIYLHLLSPVQCHWRHFACACLWAVAWFLGSTAL